MDLSNKEVLRYSRQLTLSEIGTKGQLKLKKTKVLIIGAGGLGSPLAIYLAGSGVGKIGIIDFDLVDFSNLQRQIAYREKDVGLSKVFSLKESLKELNPYIKIHAYNEKLDYSNARMLFDKYDIIADGSDNFHTRYLCNDAAFFSKKPLISAAIYKFHGQLSIFDSSSGGPCYRCLYPSSPTDSMVPS